MFYVFYVFFPLVYQQFFIKNHIWLVIRQRMSKCVFYVSLCFSSFQFFKTGLCFMGFLCFLPSPPNFSCYVFSVFSFFLFQIAFSSIFSPCVFVMFFVSNHQFFFLLQKFHFFTPILCPFSFFPCLFSANPFFC